MYGHSNPPPPQQPPYAPARAAERRRPMVPLACPCCGAIVRANALDRMGDTKTACSKCEGTIWIGTDDEGAIISIDGVEKETKKDVQMDWRSAVAGVLVTLIIIGFLFFIAKAPATAPAQTKVPLNFEQPERAQ